MITRMKVRYHSSRVGTHTTVQPLFQTVLCDEIEFNGINREVIFIECGEVKGSTDQVDGMTIKIVTI